MGEVAVDAQPIKSEIFIKGFLQETKNIVFAATPTKKISSFVACKSSNLFHLSSPRLSSFSMSSDQASPGPTSNEGRAAEEATSDTMQTSLDASAPTSEAAALPAASSAPAESIATTSAATAGDATMAQVLSTVETLTSVFGFDVEVASNAVEAVGEERCTCFSRAHTNLVKVERHISLILLASRLTQGPM